MVHYIAATLSSGDSQHQAQSEVSSFRDIAALFQCLHHPATELSTIPAPTVMRFAMRHDGYPFGVCLSGCNADADTDHLKVLASNSLRYVEAIVTDCDGMDDGQEEYLIRKNVTEKILLLKKELQSHCVQDGMQDQFGLSGVALFKDRKGNDRYISFGLGHAMVVLDSHQSLRTIIPATQIDDETFPVHLGADPTQWQEICAALEVASGRVMPGERLIFLTKDVYQLLETQSEKFTVVYDVENDVQQEKRMTRTQLCIPKKFLEDQIDLERPAEKNGHHEIVVASISVPTKAQLSNLNFKGFAQAVLEQLKKDKKFIHQDENNIANQFYRYCMGLNEVDPFTLMDTIHQWQLSTQSQSKVWGVFRKRSSSNPKNSQTIIDQFTRDMIPNFQLPNQNRLRIN